MVNISRITGLLVTAREIKKDSAGTACWRAEKKQKLKYQLCSEKLMWMAFLSQNE